MPRKINKKRKQGALSRLVNHWVDRLVAAATHRSFTAQDEEYSAHQTTYDFIFNSIGIGAWGVVFPLLTIVVTQCVGVDQAGIFSLAFVTGTLLMIIGNYGVRTYQVSDIDEDHSFADYQINRIITCILMVVAGYVYCCIRGYAGEMLTVSMGVYLYRMVDALADVYEGRLQQVDKMYLAGISQAFRSACVLIIFSVALFITRSLSFSCIVMAIVAFATLVVLTIPLAFMETPKSRRWSTQGIANLFKRCFPVFVALFLYCLIDNMPKFMMEGPLPYDNQLYFNVLYFPAQGILLTASLLYKPLLLRLAAAWDDPNDHKTFNVIMFAVFGAIVAITIFNLIIMGWIGIPIMSLLYNTDFEQFRTLMNLMIIAGGITAAIDFIYQLITVQRRQNSVVKLYLITFAFSVVASFALINSIGLTGAIVTYLAEMCLLFVLILLQFLDISVKTKRRRKVDSRNLTRYWG